MMTKIFNKSQRAFVSTHKERKLPKCFEHISIMTETKKKMRWRNVKKKIIIKTCPLVYCKSCNVLKAGPLTDLIQTFILFERRTEIDKCVFC